MQKLQAVKRQAVLQLRNRFMMEQSVIDLLYREMKQTEFSQMHQ